VKNCESKPLKSRFEDPIPAYGMN